MPLSLGRPMSSRIRSGLSSSAFLTASTPSETSQTMCHPGFFGRIAEETKRRQGSESSATKMRIFTPLLYVSHDNAELYHGTLWMHVLIATYCNPTFGRIPYTSR